MKKALLVGINKYSNSPLRGCVNDCVMVFQILTSKFGFKQENIKILEDYDATKENIVMGLKWLTQGVSSGDTIVFHYSGHGSQVMVDDWTATEEVDGRDEILCVDGLNYISTDQGLMTAECLYNKLVEGSNIKAKIGSNFYTITNKFKTLKEKYIKILFDYKNPSKYGFEHPIVVHNDGEIKPVLAKDVKPGMQVIKQFNNWNEQYEVDLLWQIIGLFIGDGYFYSKDTIRFGIRSYQKYWIDIINKAKELKGMEVKYNYNNRGDLIIYMKSNKLCSILLDMGFFPKKSKRLRDKNKFYIPNNPIKAKSIIRGIFDADGSSGKNIINLVSDDIDIIKAISITLNRFGIDHGVSNRKYCYININNSNAKNFIDIIGFGINEKNEKVKSEHSHNYSGTKGKFYLPSIKRYLDTWNIKKDHFSAKCLELKKGANCRYDNSNFTKGQLKNIIEWLYDNKKILNKIINNEVKIEDYRLSIGASMDNVAKIIDMNMWTINDRWRKGNFESIILYSKEMLIDTNNMIKKIENLISYLKYFDLTTIKEVLIINKDNYMYDFTVDEAHKFESDGLLVHNCPINLDWNNPLRDHEIGAYFKRVPKDCETLVIMDNCHSGTGLRNGFDPGDKFTDNDYVNRFISPPVSNILKNGSVIINDDLSFGFPDPKTDCRAGKNNFLVNTADQGDAILISGCQENQTSADAWLSNRYQGAMTYTLGHVLQKYNYDITYSKLVTEMNKILDKYKFTQNPQLECVKEFFNKKFLK